MARVAKRFLGGSWPQAAYLLWAGNALLHKHIQQGGTGVGFEDVRVCSDPSARDAALFLPNSPDEFANHLQEKGKEGRDVPWGAASAVLG